MRGMGQWRQAVVWGCVAWFSNCPWNGVRTNVVPLEFGMTPEVVSTALRGADRPRVGQQRQ